MTENPQITLSLFSADDLTRHIAGLGALLRTCVEDGASVNFVLPFTQSESVAFWRTKVLPSVQNGTRLLLVAQHAGEIAGSVQLDFDTPPNQPHRADLGKLLVHPDYRRQGIATALITDLEQRARDLGRTLITLDTRTGDTAEPLYISLGYTVSGIVPFYASNPAKDGFHSATFMYKIL